MMSDNNRSNNDAMVPSPLLHRNSRRRRRRRKKNTNDDTDEKRSKNCAMRSSDGVMSMSNNVDEQDAALEREVDSYLNWGEDQDGDRKRQRRSKIYGGSASKNSSPSSMSRAHRSSLSCSASRAAKVNGNSGHDSNCSSRMSLPLLLHLREIGLPRNRSFNGVADSNGRALNIICSSFQSWKSQMLHQPISYSNPQQKMGAGNKSYNGTDGEVNAASDQNENDENNDRYYSLARLRVPVHPSSSSNSQWNALQYSSPTYYYCYNDTTTTNSQQNNASQQQDNHNLEYNNGNNKAQSKQMMQLSKRKCWRPYTQKQSHRIPFSKLRTPHSDAILAVSGCGGYLIGVGGDIGIGGTYPHLCVKFFGVPSPARLQQTSNKMAQRSMITTTDVSPLLHTVPLLTKNSNSVENRNFPCPSSLLGHNEYASPAAEVPIQILLSRSGTMGVAFLHHSTAAAWSSVNNSSGSTFSESPALQDEDILGTIVIFEMPQMAPNQQTSRRAKSFRCSNVRVGGWSSFTMRNALWPATLIPTANTGNMDSKENDEPTSSQKHYLCHSFCKVCSAYVLFNDEDDGFRITWVTVVDGLDGDEGMCNTEESNSLFINSPNTIRPTRNDIVMQSEDDIWEDCLSDPETGQYINDDSGQTGHPCSGGLNIAYDAYLRVDALLSDIISRRQSSLFKNSPYQKNDSVFFMPDFFYNLVSVSPDNLKVILAVVFSNKEKMMMHSTMKKVPSALGVIVEINLYDQSYNELKWVQHPSCSDASSMKQWCNSLALNRRMRQCCVGVFCLGDNIIGSQMDNWVCGTHECNIDEDLADDINNDLWSDYLDRRNATKRKSNVVAPKDISMSSLYTHCDVITNRAVHNAVPVKRMASRHSSIELIYG